MITRTRRYLGSRGLGPTLVKAVVGSAGLRLLGMGFTFLVGVQLARGLGPEGYGIYGLAIAVVSLLGVPSQFGLPQLLTREVAAAQALEDWGKLRGVLRWAYRAILSTSALVAAAASGWLLITDRDLSSPLGMAMLIGLIMVPMIALGAVQGAVLRGLQYIVMGQLPDTVIRPALYSTLLFIAYLVAFPLDAPSAVGLGAASATLAACLSVWLLARRMPAPVVTATTRTESKAWWLSALPMALTEGMRVLQTQTSIIVLGFMVTVAEVGLFRVASSVALVLALPATIMNTVGAPIISRLHAAGDRESLQKLLSYSALAMFAATSLLVAPFLFFGEELMGTVFGREFSPSGLLVLILGTGAALSAMFGISATLLNMTGHQSMVTRASGTSLLLLVVLSPLLVSSFGIVGAAAAASVASIAWKAIMWRSALRLTGLDTSLRLPVQSRVPKND